MRLTNKNTLLLFFILTTYNLLGQTPKMGRVLGWQIDTAQNETFDQAVLQASNVCMEASHVSFAWSEIEPANGNFDMNFIHNNLDLANNFYSTNQIKIELQISTINTTTKETPYDLQNIAFDNPTMISRFKILLDTLFQHMPDVELIALNIGNESDVYFGTSSNQYQAYKTFLDSVIPYAKQKYFALHGTNLKVGTTFTFEGLTSSSTSSLCHLVNNATDMVSTTYYPLNPDFTMGPPNIVFNHFNNLINQYNNPSKPIYIVELGYASSLQCNSSENQQAQFYQNVFEAWDNHSDIIRYISFFKLTDWSQEQVNYFANYYGITDPIFLEFLRTLGVRENNGNHKPAFDIIACELFSRNWCTTDCVIGSTDDLQPNMMTIFPNPAENKIFIKIKHPIKSIKIYNFSGQILYRGKKKIINLEKFPNGFYMVKVKTKNNHIFIRKLIKN